MSREGKQVTVALDTLGCKLNQAETELIADRLCRAGCCRVASATEADIYILNTCTVTHVADRKSRHLLRLAHRRNPEAVIIAAGCYAQRVPDELKRLEGVSLVLDNAAKMRLPQLLADRGYLKDVAGEDSVDSGLRSRSFIRVQDGCQNRCAYCIVSEVRPQERSFAPEDIIAGINGKTAAGYREVVLTGTEVGAYQYASLGLAGLLERILAQTDIARLRLSSLQPNEITHEFISLWQDPRLCSHFHLSLQSGSDAVLRRMRRRYNRECYAEAVSLIRSMVTDVAITTDVIVGFPGETDAEFAQSYEFCRRMGFARIHVFPYSSRPGTEAAQMPDKVSAAVKRERLQKMLALAEESAAAFRQQYMGREVPALWEQQAGGVWSGLTGNYIRVYTRSSLDLANHISKVKLEKLHRDGVWGNSP